MRLLLLFAVLALPRTRAVAPPASTSPPAPPSTPTNVSYEDALLNNLTGITSFGDALDVLSGVAATYNVGLMPASFDMCSSDAVFGGAAVEVFGQLNDVARDQGLNTQSSKYGDVNEMRNKLQKYVARGRGRVEVGG